MIEELRETMIKETSHKRLVKVNLKDNRDSGRESRRLSIRELAELQDEEIMKA